MAIDPTWLTGSNGGIMAMAFAAGCAGGYGFAARTILKAAQERIGEFKLTLQQQRLDFEKKLEDEREQRRDEREDCKRELASLKDELKQMREMLIGKRAIGYFDDMRTPRDTPPDMIGKLRKLDEGE